MTEIQAWEGYMGRTRVILTNHILIQQQSEKGFFYLLVNWCSTWTASICVYCTQILANLLCSIQEVCNVFPIGDGSYACTGSWVWNALLSGSPQANLGLQELLSPVGTSQYTGNSRKMPYVAFPSKHGLNSVAAKSGYTIVGSTRWYDELYQSW